MTRNLNKYTLFLIISNLISCATSSTRDKKVILSSPVPMVKAVPFEARNNNSASPMRPRMLILMGKVDPLTIPEEWSSKTENFLWKELERSDAYVMLRPSEIGLDVKDMVDHGRWDWQKINQKLKDKSIPLALEWELLPIQASQDVDPVGIMRERRRKLTVQVKARLMDTRKGIEITKEIGSAVQKEKDILWLSKEEGQLGTADYDKVVLEELLRAAVYNVIPPLLAKTPQVSWSGRIAMLKNDRLYLNVGRQSGLQVGDILKVLDASDEVFDPDSGESIGKVPGRMKGTLEVIGYFGSDGSVAVVHSGAGFQENDAIEYY